MRYNEAKGCDTYRALRWLSFQTPFGSLNARCAINSFGGWVIKRLNSRISVFRFHIHKPRAATQMRLLSKDYDCMTPSGLLLVTSTVAPRLLYHIWPFQCWFYPGRCMYACLCVYHYRVPRAKRSTPLFCWRLEAESPHFTVKLINEAKHRSQTVFG